MPSMELRELIEKAAETDDLKVINNADWNLEIGGIAFLSHHKLDNPPLILFDNVKDYPPGYRILINSLSTIKRLNMVAGLPQDNMNKLETIEKWRFLLKNVRSIAPEYVQNGPILENVYLGSEVDVLKFPAPWWHELDGGRYIGTGSITITRDPDDGSINIGTYRVMVHDKKTLGFYVSHGGHARIHRDKYFSKGKPCPVAVCFGQDPLLFLTGSMPLATGMSEYDYAGGLKGKAIKVIKGPVTGLPIPANAEIAIEGYAYPEDRMDEGPFGEWTGYYGSSVRPEPYIRVESVMHRNDPIILGAPPSKPPWDSSLQLAIPKSAMIWNTLESAGIPDVKGVYRPEVTGGNTLIIISIKQRFPGHARQAALIAAGSRAGAYMGRYIVVVDDDIDPTNLNDVFWAIASRSDPQRSIDILRECLSSDLDPIIPKNEKGLNSKAIIDACRPYKWINEFPPIAQPSPELQEMLWSKWEGKLR